MTIKETHENGDKSRLSCIVVGSSRLRQHPLPLFRLARKVVCITMGTYYEWHFIILLYLFRQREGRVGAVPIENLCCASVLSDSQAIRRSESLASARRNEERERVFYRYCPCSPLFNV